MDKLFQGVNDLIVKNAINLSLFIALLSFAVVFWIRYTLIFYPFPDLGGIEPNVIYSIQRILAGFTLFEHPELPPYSITQYSPLYYYITAFAGKIFNINPDKPIEVFILSRSMSLFFNIATLGVCFSILKNLYKVDTRISITTCVFIFLYLERNIYSRPDSLYTLFFAIAIFLFIVFLKEQVSAKRLLSLVFSSIAVVLAIFTKQTGIFMPILFMVFLLFFMKNIKEALICLVTMTVSCLVLLFLTAGDSFSIFFLNVYDGVDNGIDLMFFYMAIVKPYFRSILIWNVLSFSVALYYLRKDSEMSLKFMSFSIITTFIFALGTGIKFGATPSYFTEYLILTFCTLTIYLFMKGRYFNNDKVRIVLFLTVFFFLPYLTVDHYGMYELFYTNYAPQSYEKSNEVSQYLYEDRMLKPTEKVFVQGVNYPERRFLDNFLYKNNIMPQKKVFNHNINADPINYSFDYTHITSNINKGLIKYFIASKEINSTTFLGVELTNFKHIKDINDYSIYIYDPAPPQTLNNILQTPAVNENNPYSTKSSTHATVFRMN